MNMQLTRVLAAFAFSGMLLAGCAQTTAAAGSATGTATSMATDASKAAVTALAAKVGVGENYVTMALDAAKGLLGSGTPTAEAKAAAAQQGVDKAAAQAQTDGKAFTDEQKNGLIEGLKGML